MSLPKNEVVPVLNGYVVRYNNGSWLCHGTHWSDNEDNAIVFGSKFVATMVAKFWDAKRKSAARDQ